MFPIVSNRAPPTGHLLRSILAAFRCSQNSRTLLPKSNTESIPVARSDRERDEMAAYTRWKVRWHFELAFMVEVPTLNDTQSEIANQTSINGNFDLLRAIFFKKSTCGGKFDPRVVWRLPLTLSRLQYALPLVSIAMRLAGAVWLLFEITASFVRHKHYFGATGTSQHACPFCGDEG